MFHQGFLIEGKSSVDLHVPINFRSAAFYISKKYLHFLQKVYLIEEVNCTEPSPSVGVPWFNPSKLACGCSTMVRAFHCDQKLEGSNPGNLIPLAKVFTS